MLPTGVSFLCFCIVTMQLLHVAIGAHPIDDPEYRAFLEDKVVSSVSLKELEEMVENDEKVRNAPKSKLIIIPKKKNTAGLLGEDEREAIIIQRKPKKTQKQIEKLEYRFDDIDLERNSPKSSYSPRFDFESNFRKFDDDIPSLFSLPDLESAGSSRAEHFYESIVDSVMRSSDFGRRQDPFEVLALAGSDAVPQYQPRFDYDAYSKDSTETKLQGKPYWKDAQERKDEMIDENGCRTVIKKMVDPEDEKKPGQEKAKTVVITKECEYPSLNGPDAKITEATPLRIDTSRFDRDSSADFEERPISYDENRPVELNFKSDDSRDPLAPDYIDSMLDKHFKSFPGFTNPLSSFKGYQERFKLRIPEAFKDVKPTVGVQTYEYSNPKSGFEEERQSATSKDSTNNDSPKTYEHHYHYDYPPQNSRKPEYDDSQEVKSAAKSSGSKDSKDPKMMKKSFAYYRKDNPKDDPNDHQYAEEYAQGNFRSFSSSYDSEKDGAKKKQ